MYGIKTNLVLGNTEVKRVGINFFCVGSKGGERLRANKNTSWGCPGGR